MNINEELSLLYNSNLHGIKEISNHFSDRLDGPLLMYPFHNSNYDVDKNKKILFIGQEPNSWVSWACDEIETPLERYKAFALEDPKKANPHFGKPLTS